MRTLIGVISDLIPDSIKTDGWLKFDRKQFWKLSRWCYDNDFELAYIILRLHERNLMHARIIRCKP